jgi:excisionase family DNA binding protein
MCCSSIMSPVSEITRVSRERLMTVAEVADRLNVSPQWVYDHATRSDPRLPCIRLGGAVRFALTAIDQFIEQQSKASAAAQAQAEVTG